MSPHYTIVIEIRNKYIELMDGNVSTNGGAREFGLMNMTPDELMAIAQAYKDGNWNAMNKACEAARKW